MCKTVIKKLESHMDKKYPDYRAKIYINRRNKLLHLGLDKALFDNSNYRLYLWDCEWFLKEQLTNVKFEFFRIPNLINCTKWKFDYIIARRDNDNWTSMFLICYL